MRLQDTLKVARWEFVKNIKSPTFLALTLAMPILMVIGGLVGYLGTASAQKEAQQVAVIDETGALYPILKDYLSTSPVTTIAFAAADRDRLSDEVRAGTYAGYLHITQEAVLTGNVPYYVKDTRDQRAVALSEAVRYSVTRYRLLQAGLSPDQVRLVTAPVVLQVRSLAGEAASWVEMLVPYAVTLILVLAAIFSGQVLMYGVMKEKRNRIVEILLSSISSLDLLLGKLLGFAALGLIQVTIWMAVGLAVAARFIDFGRLSLSAADLAPAVLFFVGGYLLFASLYAAAGATMKDAEETSQAQGLVLIIPMIPLFTASAIIMAPNAFWVRVLSFVPPFTPVTVLLRMAATTLPWWEIAAAFAVMVLSVAFFIIAGARIFDRSILQYDRTISLREIGRMLRREYS
ncbi:MAG: ABC transporter permease [Bacillota bacterium]